MAGYVGAPARLGTLIEDPPHSLEHQSYAHREMRTAIVNADGWGAAWYLENELGACAYRTVHPIWGDGNRTSLCRTIQSTCLLAAVRSATEPLGLTTTNTQPFVHGPLSFLHNGYLQGFRDGLMRPLREGLSDTAYRAIHGDTDSEHVFGAVIDAHEREVDLVRTVREVVPRVLDLARRREVVALLTLMISDGTSIVAVRAASGGEPPSLYVSTRGAGTRFASEPLEPDADWHPLPPHTIFAAGSGHLRQENLA